MCIVIGADHYVFPEDCLQEEMDVVRTVEEETLFTVAFPDIVQLFHKETTETKDNKLKKSMSLFVLLTHSQHISFNCFWVNKPKQHTLNNAYHCTHNIQDFVLLLMMGVKIFDSLHESDP